MSKSTPISHSLIVVVSGAKVQLSLAKGLLDQLLLLLSLHEEITLICTLLLISHSRFPRSVRHSFWVILQNDWLIYDVEHLDLWH